jgi:hypothetical protein
MKNTILIATVVVMWASFVSAQTKPLRMFPRTRPLQLLHLQACQGMPGQGGKDLLHRFDPTVQRRQHDRLPGRRRRQAGSQTGLAGGQG